MTDLTRICDNPPRIPPPKLISVSRTRKMTIWSSEGVPLKSGPRGQKEVFEHYRVIFGLLPMESSVTNDPSWRVCPYDPHGPILATFDHFWMYSCLSWKNDENRIYDIFGSCWHKWHKCPEGVISKARIHWEMAYLSHNVSKWPYGVKNEGVKSVKKCDFWSKMMILALLVQKWQTLKWVIF